jgi:hypothetical protein
MIGEEGTAYIFAKQILAQDEAPFNTCHSSQFWPKANWLGFDPEHEDYATDISKDMRYIQLKMAVLDPSVIFTHHQWKGDKL